MAGVTVLGIVIFTANIPFSTTQLNVARFVDSNVQLREEDVLQVKVEINSLSNSTNITTIIARVEDTNLAVVVNDTEIIVLDAMEEYYNYTLLIKGVFLGRTRITLTSQTGQPITEVCIALAQQALPVAILRTANGSKLSLIFTVAITAAVFINTFIMGLTLDREVLVKILKRPLAVLIGFVCQFCFMPLVAAGWSYALLRDAPSLLFGLFVTGCCPGGGQSNTMTILFNGNINLSIAMTFFSNIAALGMMPLWIYTLGRFFYESVASEENTKLEVPFTNIIISLLLLIAPVFVGMIFKHFKPLLAAKIAKLIKFTSLGIVVFVIPFGIYANLYLFQLFTWKKVLCGMLLPYTGFVLAFVAALIFRQNRDDRVTIALETGIQNGSIAVILLQYSLPHPDSDLTLVMPLIVIITTPLPLLVILIFKTIYEKCFKKNDKVGDKSAMKPAETTDLPPYPKPTVEGQSQIEFTFDQKRNSVHL